MMSRITAPVGEVTMPMRLGAGGEGDLALGAEFFLQRLEGQVQGGHPSEPPRIGYVGGSLIRHAIKGIEYDPVDQPLT